MASNAARNIWDSYANWAEVAESAPVQTVRDTISGLPGMWDPNHVSPQLADLFTTLNAEFTDQDGVPPTVLDFGCGLGRNAPMLRRHFSRVVATDLPEMLARLRAEHPDDAALPYDAIYPDLDAIERGEEVRILYASVVFQHLADPLYVEELAEKLVALPSLSVVVCLDNRPTLMREMLRGLHGWSTLMAEQDPLSFSHKAHLLDVLRRPGT